MNECSAECSRTLRYCLDQGGEYATPEHIETLMDCAEACRMAAGFMARSSSNTGATCALSAELCLACEESCQQIGIDDKIIQHCATVCGDCAEECRQMAS